MKCKICANETEKVFRKKILSNYDVQYYKCDNCGFLQTEDPYWLSEAYAETINDSDIGYVSRNINLARKISILLRLYFGKSAKFLDYAGGYGLFTRLMRDKGFDFFWSDKFTANIFSKGFETETDNEKFDAVTSFESFEHFASPKDEIDKIFSLAPFVVITTELFSDNFIKDCDWWYLGLEHGQHISFYSEKTLHYVAKLKNRNYIKIGAIHIFSEKKIPFYVSFLMKLSNISVERMFLIGMRSHVAGDYAKAIEKIRRNN